MKKKIIVEIENSKGYKVTFDLFDEDIIKAAGFTRSEIRDAIPVNTFFYIPGTTYSETTPTGRVLARPEHPWGGSVGVYMTLQNVTPVAISLQIVPSHDTYGHKRGHLKGIPHWNAYMKILDPRRSFTPENPLLKPVPFDWAHVVEDSDFLRISMTPIYPKGERKEGRINHPLKSPP